MTRPYNVIDADGHILEPLTLWNDYMDPAFRDRAPKLIIDNDGKEKLFLENQVLGSQQVSGHTSPSREMTTPSRPSCSRSCTCTLSLREVGTFLPT